MPYKCLSDTAEIRRRHGIKLLHLVEQADVPLRALLEQLIVMRQLANEMHFSRDGECNNVRQVAQAFESDMQWLGGLAQWLIDRSIPGVEAWEPGDVVPDADGELPDSDCGVPV